jgi:hypothetical protein
MEKEKQEFQLGDIAYMIDDDYRFFESEVHRVELCRDGTIEYSTWDCDFNTEDINDWVYKSEQDREVLQLLR